MKKHYGYNKLRGRIIEKYCSMKEFHRDCSDELGLSYVTMSLKMSGRSGFSQEDIEIWARLLDIDRADYGEYFFT